MTPGTDQSGSRLAELRERLGEIAAAPEYARSEPTWIERLQEKLLEFLGEVLGSLFGQGAGESALAWLVFGGVAVVVVLLLVAFGRRMLEAPARAGRAMPAAGGFAGNPGAITLASARSLAAAGRWREAGERLYATVLEHLGREGRVVVADEKTPSDYRRELAGSDHRSPFVALVRGLDPVLWGGREGDAGRFDEWARRARELGVTE